MSFNATDGSQSNQDALDVGNDVHTLLLAQLRAIKARPNVTSISNFASYVAAIAYNACYGHLRKKYPQRARLKNRVRYLLANNETFVLWESPERQWLCGFAQWRDQNRKPAQLGRLQQLADKPELLKADGDLPVVDPATPHASVLTATRQDKSARVSSGVTSCASPR